MGVSSGDSFSESGSLTVVEFVCKSEEKDVGSGRPSFLLNDVDLWQFFSIFFSMHPPTQTRLNAEGDGEAGKLTLA